MPYITKNRREALDSGNLPQNAGELNYMFYSISRHYAFYKGECYQTYNDIIGALEGSKLEIYRRDIANYEEEKIKSNGDI